MTSPSFLILGTDAVLAAAPATPVQLAHACAAAGYDAAVPVSWGEEIIARRAIADLEKAKTPLVFCVCPRAAQRFAGDAAIAPMLFSFAAPPVVTAAYLRALSAPTRVHVTYAGGCAAAAHPLIDTHLTPDALFTVFAQRGIALSAQPTEFDAVLPPDRRRYFSEAGGLPATAVLERLVPRASVVQVRDGDFVIDLAQHLLGVAPALIDVGTALGCHCQAPDARGRIRELEPPRAPSPVVDHDLTLPFDPPPPRPAEPPAPPVPQWTDPTPPPGPAATPAEVVGRAEPMPRPGPAAVPRPSPGVPLAVADLPIAGARPRQSSSSARVVVGTAPQSRSPGRQLPRAYVARRRSSPKGVRRSGVTRQVGADKAGGLGFRAWIGIAAAIVLLAVATLVLLQVIAP